MLKTFTFSFKRFVIGSFVLLCFGSVAFCLYKVLYALITKPISQSKPNWSSQVHPKSNGFQTKLQTNMFFLQLKDFTPVSEQVELIEGKKYLIFKVLEHEEERTKCLYGSFELIKKNSQHFSFKILNHFDAKKFEHYAHFKQKIVKYRIVSQEQVASNTLNCKNWLNVRNMYQLFESDLESTHKNISVKFKQSHCSSVSGIHIVSAESLRPQLAYFEYNTVTNRLKLCVKKKGDAVVRYLTDSSVKYELQNLKIQ